MSWITMDTKLGRHPKMAELPNDTARYGWVLTLLEAKEQRHPGTFASANHFRHVMGKYGRFLDAYVKAGLIDKDEDGTIHVHDWQRHQWSVSKQKQRGQDEDKNGTSVGQEEDASRAVSVPVLVGSTEGGGLGEETAEGAVFSFLAHHGAAIRPDAPLGRRLFGLMDRRGADAVLAEAQAMAKIENVMSDRQWVLGLENGLEAIPTGKKTVDVALQEEAKLRDEARYARTAARRVEWFQNTGKWDESWGPRPEGTVA